MLRILFLMLVLLTGYFSSGQNLWIVADVPPLNPYVSLEGRPGVSAFDSEIARRGAAFAAREMEQTLGLDLNRRVSIILAPDSRSYSKILSEEEGIRPEQALTQSAMTNGGSIANRIIVNIGGIDVYTDALFVVAHEIAHQYHQAAFTDVSRLNWLHEGIADWTAARSVAANFGEEYRDPLGQVSQYRKTWLKSLVAVIKYPNLQELDRREDWLASIRSHGPVLPYRVSALAVFRLLDQCGESALRMYFTQRATGALPDDAFFTAFGFTPAEFYANYSEWLKAELIRY